MKKPKGLHTEVTYEKPELPDVRRVDAGSIESGYKRCSGVSRALEVSQRAS